MEELSLGWKIAIIIIDVILIVGSVFMLPKIPSDEWLITGVAVGLMWLGFFSLMAVIT